MKHAILGAGAIGGLMATALSSLGEDVTLIVRSDKLAEQPLTLTLERPGGTLTAPAKVAARVTGSVDVLWIATKTYQLDAALELVETTPGTIVPLLNGVDHIAVLRARFGHDRVVPATIAVEAERSAPGRFVHRTPVRLNVAASGEPLLKEVIEGLRGLGFACQFIASESTLLWGKLCFLEPFALVTSASGKNNGEIHTDAEWKAKLESAVHEACAVATKESAQVDADKILAVYPGAPPAMRASMAKDLAAGRPLELDGIAGPVLRGGARHGVPTPTTASLVATIEAVVQARTK
ncbi:MAG TPA: 2-dehydropantoate 2-reductase [Candidatus Eisenbacteria bacterium]|nr:2-dehydropantoate 2-reductase [Candidatus Eisenbacteria bacterium]